MMINAMLGAATGAVLRVWANALSKQRFFYRPWNHVVFIGVGGYVGYHYNQWESDLLKAVNDKREVRGMPLLDRKSLTNFTFINKE